MSAMQTEVYAIPIGGRSPHALSAILGAAYRRIMVAVGLLSSRAAERRGLSTLARFDDRMLADIGLTRSQLGPPPREFIVWW